MDEARLSDFSVKVQDASIPLPIMTCIHVQPDVSAKVYHGSYLYVFCEHKIFGNISVWNWSSLIKTVLLCG